MYMSNPIIDKFGNKRRFNKRWYNEQRKLHREDGPAVELANGSKAWWLNDKLHREDGPAIEWASGDTFWYLNGKLHRTNGPACEWDDRKEWWLNGKQYTEEEFLLLQFIKGVDIYVK